MAKKSTAIDVTQGVIWQQLLSLCVPIFFSSFFQQAYTLIGTYIVGQFGGKLALGGIQATMVLTELCIGFCVGVGAGCAVITGQYFGQSDVLRPAVPSLGPREHGHGVSGAVDAYWQRGSCVAARWPGGTARSRFFVRCDGADGRLRFAGRSCAAGG